MSATGFVVWIIWRKDSEGPPIVWHATTELREAVEILGNVDDDELQAYWWTIRQQEIAWPA